VLTLRLYDQFADDRLRFEQLHLRVAELFAARSILLDPHQPQTLFQHANPQLRVLQPALQLCDEFQIGILDRNSRQVASTSRVSSRTLTFLAVSKRHSPSSVL